VQLRIPIARWFAWPAFSGLGAEPIQSPDVRFVEPSLRRRLGPLARMMRHVAHACAQDVQDVRLVFASQHGELNYTIALLRALAAGEPLSPTTFSLSVHNACAGLFSILRADLSASTALAAGAETLGHALVEAFCQLNADAHKPVLMVYADGPLPEEYRAYAETNDAPGKHGAVAVLISPYAARATFVEAEPAGNATPSTEPQVDVFVRHLAEKRPECWTGGQRTWRWH
jgi:hypothetical protein